MDHVSVEKRSFIMSRIRQKDTVPEILVRRRLFREGYRYRVHVRSLPGTPDIVFSKARLALFVNGCFWHGHSGCPKSKTPSTRAEYWSNKIVANMARDARVLQELDKLGWRTSVIWQCELKDMDAVISRIGALLDVQPKT